LPRSSLRPILSRPFGLLWRESLVGDRRASIDTVLDAACRVLHESQDELTALDVEDQGKELGAGGRQVERAGEGGDKRAPIAELKVAQAPLRGLPG